MASDEKKIKLKFHEDQVYKAMREKKELTDVVLICDGGEVEAHRLILSVRCPYFKTMFLGDFEESSTKRVNFSFLKKEVMVTILDCIYLNQVMIKPGESVDNLIQIYQLSHLFQINVLSSYCMKLILKNINTDSWLKIWELVYLHGNDREICKVIDFILENLSEIVDKDFLTLTFDQVVHLLEKINQNHIAVEEDFLESVIEWFKKTNQPKIHLRTIFLQINFNFMSREFMTDLWEKEENLFEDDFFKEFFKLQFLPKLETNSELIYNFPLKMFIFLANETEYSWHNVYETLKLKIFDCETTSFNKIFDNLPFKLHENMTHVQYGSYSYIVGGIPKDISQRIVSAQSKFFFLFDWKKNQIVMKPSLLEEAINPLTCVSENNIYVISRNNRVKTITIQYFSVTEEKWFAKKYLLIGGNIIGCVSVKDVVYLVCEDSSGYYFLILNKLKINLGPLTPIPKSTIIDNNHMTVYKDRMFFLLSNYELYIFDPDTQLWNVRKTSIPNDFLINKCLLFPNKFLMFYNIEDRSLYRFHTNKRDIKKIMTVGETSHEEISLFPLGIYIFPLFFLFTIIYICYVITLNFYTS